MKRILALLALSLLTLTARAGVWDFYYLGTMEFNPFYGTDGSFTATDANGDGIIVGSEVTSLTFFGHIFEPPSSMNLPGIDVQSALTSFHFDTFTGQLEFDCFGGEWQDVVEKDGLRLFYSDGRGGYAFTLVGPPVVTARALAAPVPEPDTYALLLAGLAVVALVRRRA
jgi:hypothetical protein